MLLLPLLSAFTHLISAVPVNEHELLTRELDAGPYSSTLVKRSLHISSGTGHEQRAELEHGHSPRLRRAEGSEPHAFLPVGSEQHQQRLKRGFGKWVGKAMRGIARGAGKILRNTQISLSWKGKG